ncbi:MAG: bi-domain-containing oxidoreductase [Gaiellaceae bacterium]
MKQVTQRLRDGRIEVIDVPAPELRPEGVLVAVRASVLSAGTERKKIETGRQNLLGKARARPAEVRRVIDKARRDGVGETLRAVRARLDQPEALGYSAAGIVIASGSRVSDLAAGERVACGGGGYAAHAEIDYVPGSLAVRVPDGIDFEAAAFTTVGSIALHAVRQAGAQLGERVAVLGLGLVGHLAGQILRAGGCRVIGFDPVDELVDHALRSRAVDSGFSSSLPAGQLPADALDCDAVLIAAATPSSEPVRFAAAICRDRGRVVVVGDVGMQVPRALYYEKELELRMSRSYGPGRYDREYEERGLDYPVGYVRWTERRNMSAFLDLVAAGKVDVEPLISERVSIEDAPSAYDRLVKSGTSPLGIVLAYDEPGVVEIAAAPPTRRAAPARANIIGVVGAGSFATRILIPALRAAGFRIEAVASAGGLSAYAAAERVDARAASVDEVLADHAVGSVAIATRHASHARLAIAGLQAGKAVFVEKPPALNESELDDLRRARSAAGRLLFVGFNRRHAPLAIALREHVRRDDTPIQLLYRVSAGQLPGDHWLNDPSEGGGRLLGEGCHFVDFASWLVGAPPRRVAFAAEPPRGQPLAAAQSFTVTMSFGDGSIATILYSADGAEALPKEYVEVHGGGRSAVLDDYRKLTLFGGRRVRVRKEHGQDKGHRAEVRAFRQLLEGGTTDEVDPLDSMAATLAALRAAETGETVCV